MKFRIKCRDNLRPDLEGTWDLCDSREQAHSIIMTHKKRLHYSQSDDILRVLIEGELYYGRCYSQGLGGHHVWRVFEEQE